MEPIETGTKILKKTTLIILAPLFIIIGIITVGVLILFLKLKLHDSSHWEVVQDKNKCVLISPEVSNYTQIKLRYYKDGSKQLVVESPLAKKYCLLYHKCKYPILLNDKSKVFYLKLRPVIEKNDPHSLSVHYALIATNLSPDTIIQLYKNNETISLPVDKFGNTNQIWYYNFNKALDKLQHCLSKKNIKISSYPTVSFDQNPNTFNTNTTSSVMSDNNTNEISANNNPNELNNSIYYNQNTYNNNSSSQNSLSCGLHSPILLFKKHNPGAGRTLISLASYEDLCPDANIVLISAGGQGGDDGGKGGITVLKIPLSNFIQRFGETVEVYYVIGGKGSTEITPTVFNNFGGIKGIEKNGGGGGASMIAVNNWPHNGGISLVIGGGGGSSFWSAGSRHQFYKGGGGGGGNDSGQNGKRDQSVWTGSPTIAGQGGYNGQGGASGSSLGGSDDPNLVDICGGGGGGWGANSGAGSGGGTGSPGMGGVGTDGSGQGGHGYYGGGNGYTGNAGNGYIGGEGCATGGSGGYGGGGASCGIDAGGGGGYGGGGGAWIGGGGGGGYCAEYLGFCRALDWTNGNGNIGNGYVEIKIAP